LILTHAFTTSVCFLYLSIIISVGLTVFILV
jgi:hypothetical protein